MKCTQPQCQRTILTAADIRYCTTCARDGTANEISPDRFPGIKDDTPIAEVLAARPGIAVRYADDAIPTASPAAPMQPGEQVAGTTAEADVQPGSDPGDPAAAITEIAHAGGQVDPADHAADIPQASSSDPDQAANPASSQE